MSVQQCEFCKRPYDPGEITDSGRRPCCGIRPAGEMTGRIEGTCRIIGELGRGATGVVYLAQQLRLQRSAALKLMTASTLDDENAANLFFSEVRAAGKLIHPNIARIYTAGETDRQVPYSVMEFVEGRTLEEHLITRKRFPYLEVCRIAREIADALHYAWRTANLSHGDLKPANIMIRQEDDSVCILDMGLQAARQENGIKKAIGTPFYAAPELVNTDFGENDFHADIYSLGIMMYEMLTGEGPFSGTPAELLRLHQSQNAPSVRDRAPEIPEELDQLISKMLQRFTADRPTWPAVLRKLKDIESAAERARIKAEIQPVPPAKLKPNSGRLLALFLLGLLLSGLSGYTLARKTAPAVVPKNPVRIADSWQKQQAFRFAEHGKTDELEKMLRQGLPVDTENEQGNTLLMQAVFFGKTDTVKMLLRFAPDLTRRNQLGEDVFDTAKLFPEILRILENTAKQ